MSGPYRHDGLRILETILNHFLTMLPLIWKMKNFSKQTRVQAIVTQILVHRNIACRLMVRFAFWKGSGGWTANLFRSQDLFSSYFFIWYKLKARKRENLVENITSLERLCDQILRNVLEWSTTVSTWPRTITWTFFNSSIFWKFITDSLGRWLLEW